MILRKIAAFILFSLALLSFFVFFLINGIKIDSFSLGNFSVSQFYIKFDKKFIVNIDKLILSNKESNSKSSLEDLKSLIDKSEYVLNFFKNIDIEELQIEDNIFKIKFDNSYIYIDNKFVNLASQYKKDKNILTLNIYSLYLKDIDFLLLGDIKIDYEKDLANFFGNYMYKELLEGELNLEANKEYLNFFINSKEFNNLKFLKEYMSLDSIAEAWMYDNVEGKYQLDYLFGKIELDTFTPILNSIKGSARVSNANVRFHEKLEVVKTPLINVDYQNDNLLIKLEKPTYKGIDIDGSFVDIKDMTSKKYGHVDVTLMANHMLDDRVLGILEAYDINLPLKQLSGETKAAVHLYIPYDSAMKTFGSFKSKDSTFKVNDFEFYSKEGRVDLINSDVIIKNTDFVQKDLIKAKVDLKIDTKSLTSKGKAKIEEFLIKNDEQEIVNIKNETLDFGLNFNENTKLIIDNLLSSVEFKEDFTDINIKDLEKVYPYSKLLKEIDIKNGDLNIKLYDLNKLDFIANLNNLKLPLKKDDKDIHSLKLFGKIDKNITSINSLENDLKIDIKDKKIDIFLDGYDIFYNKEQNSSGFKSDYNLKVLNSNINIDDESFYSTNSNIQISKDKILFDGEFEKLNLPFSLRGEKLEKVDIKGSFSNNILKIDSKDKSFLLSIKDDDKLDLIINSLDLNYNTKGEDFKYKQLKVLGNNSNIIINNKHKVLSNYYTISSNDKILKFDLKYLNGNINFSKSKNKKIDLKVEKIDDSFINTFFNKEILKGGTFSIKASGKDELLSGRMIFDKNRLLNLAVLNNIITVVNTTPALINPLLAVPAVFGMVINGGFNLNGYNVNEGYIDFIYKFENKFLNLIKIHTVGNSVDFDGYATIDLEKSIVSSNLELVFMKDYSKIINVIPGLSYIFLGEDKRISTTITINGDLENPDIKSRLAKDSASVPYDVLKRIITSPFKLFE